MMVGALKVAPPSVEVATTWRLGWLFELASSVQKASAMPLDATASWPVSRKPWAKLVLAALICTADD
jgi:hypothetical protein